MKCTSTLRSRNLTLGTFCITLVVFLLACPTLQLDAGETWQTKTPKGVVLVMIDDIGYGDVNALSPSDLQTPNLDHLCHESLRLTDYHVGTTCSPTRASLMTGRYLNVTGVWHTIAGRSQLRENEQTMAQVFKASGWHTGVFGKWHLGEGYPFAPQYRGFDVAVIHGGGGVSQQPDFWKNNYYASKGDTVDFEGDATTNDSYIHNGENKEADEFCTDYWMTHAMKFIKQSVDEQRPFFCYIPTNAAHGPFNAPFGGKKGFDGLVENVDFNMGRLNDFLEKQGIKDDVLLIFTTDNGTAGSTRMGGLRGKKGSHYDGGHNVPCFWRWKNGGIAGTIESATDLHSLATAADLLPTFIKMFDLNRPEGGQPIHGNSLDRMLLNRELKPTSRTWVVDTQRTEDLIKFKNASVLKDEVVDGKIAHKWRMTRQNKNSNWELYDVLSDRAQEADLSAAHSEVMSELQSSYETWWSEIDDQTRDYPATVLGVEPETTLYSHDWIGSGGSPWHQNHILNGAKGTRTSSIRFHKSGNYEFELRRWPREDGGAIDEADSQGKGTTLPIAQARIVIDETTKEAAIEPGSSKATFTIKGEAGQETKLSTAFLDKEGEILCGAYYVYVRRIVD